jgi:dTDP-4-dehydrorhamnose 3,5-epimerase
MVRVLRGAIIDIVLDVRKNSSHFGQHIQVELSAEKGNWIFIPEGFAHGILTLQPDTELFYKVTDFYVPDCDRRISWNDPALKIILPVSADKMIISDRDKMVSLLKDVEHNF